MTPNTAKKKTTIHAADLYVLLQREFRRRQPPECSSCYVQLPFRVDRNHDDRDASNWEVVYPPDCTSGCKTMLEELVAEFGTLYDLGPDEGRS